MTAKRLNKFDDPEYLSDLAGKVMHSHDDEREDLLAQLLPTGFDNLNMTSLGAL